MSTDAGDDVPPVSAAADARVPLHHRFFDDASPYVDRFGLLLLITIASIIVLSLVDIVGPLAPAAKEIESYVASVIVSATLLLAARASGVARWWRRTIDVGVLAILLGLAVVEVTRWHGPIGLLDLQSGPPIFIVVLAVLAPVMVVRRLLQHREVHRGTLLGAISAYLLIPVAYFYVFLTVARYDGANFFGDPQPTASFMYFSLTTVTTTGYGDLTPASNVARLLSTSEAVTGQIYLVTFVGMLVGLAASRWRPRA